MYPPTLYILILIVSNLGESESIVMCNVSMYRAPQALTDNICGDFAVFGANGITLGAGIHVENGGDIGVSNPGSLITGILVFDHGGIISHNTSDFASSVVKNQATMAGVRGDARLISTEIGNIIFTPGFYSSVGAITLAAGHTVILDGLHHANPKFIFI